MSLPRFHVPDLDTASRTAVLSGDEAHHLSRVLRLGVGAGVAVFNGAGDEWLGRVAALARSNATIDLVERIAPVPEPPVRVTLGVALLKGDQMDAVVRDATMLGAHAIAPIVSARVVVPARAWRSGRALDRWTRVAVASARQCGRAVVPAVAPVAPLAQLLASARPDLCLVAVEPAHAGAAADINWSRTPATVLALVGPEGGWTVEEMELAVASGARPIGLGPRTLRAETAPTVLLSSLWTRWGW